MPYRHRDWLPTLIYSYQRVGVCVEDGCRQVKKSSPVDRSSRPSWQTFSGTGRIYPRPARPGPHNPYRYDMSSPLRTSPKVSNYVKQIVFTAADSFRHVDHLFAYVDDTSS
jgi:hypothetical protein